METMQTELTILNIVLIASIVVGTFMGISLLYIPKGNKYANRILAVLLLVISALLGLAFYYNRTPVMDCPHLFSAATPIPLLFGPLLFFYVKVRINDRFTFQRVDLLHLLPFVLLLFVQLLYSQLPLGSQLSLAGIIARDAYWLTDRTLLLNLFKIVFNLGYVWVSLSLISNWSKIREENLRNRGAMHLAWMKRLTWSVGFYWIVFALVFIYQVFINTNMLIVDNFLSVSLSVVTLGIGFTALQKPGIYLENHLNNKDKVKYRKSSLDNNRLKFIAERLKKSINNENLYLNQQLTLGELADFLDLPQHYISQTLSQYLDTNFFDFINWYRVQHAKELLADPDHDHLTILAIAEESGFNSKASFNRAFKKFVGVTPSRFQKDMTLR